LCQKKSAQKAKRTQPFVELIAHSIAGGGIQRERVDVGSFASWE
jgi:hypothetical protein